MACRRLYRFHGFRLGDRLKIQNGTSGGGRLARYWFLQCIEERTGHPHRVRWRSGRDVRTEASAAWTRTLAAKALASYVCMKEASPSCKDFSSDPHEPPPQQPPSLAMAYAFRSEPVSVTTTEVNPACSSKLRYSSMRIAPEMQPTYASTLCLTSLGSSCLRAMSLRVTRPPAFSTRRISRNTASLSGN